jgi:hypothetical protein
MISSTSCRTATRLIPQRLQRPGRHAVALVDEAEQQVLGADVVVTQHPGFFLRQDNHPQRPAGKPLEHRPPPRATEQNLAARPEHRPDRTCPGTPAMIHSQHAPAATAKAKGSLSAGTVQPSDPVQHLPPTTSATPGSPGGSTQASPPPRSPPPPGPATPSRCSCGPAPGARPPRRRLDRPHGPGPAPGGRPMTWGAYRAQHPHHKTASRVRGCLSAHP